MQPRGRKEMGGGTVSLLRQLAIKLSHPCLVETQSYAMGSRLQLKASAN